MKSILEKLREKGDAFFFPRIRAGYKKALDDVEREVLPNYVSKDKIKKRIKYIEEHPLYPAYCLNGQAQELRRLIGEEEENGS